MEQSGQRVSVLGDGIGRESIKQSVPHTLVAIDEYEVTLRELYLALATSSARSGYSEAVA